jgi:hypothetical protein
MPDSDPLNLKTLQVLSDSESIFIIGFDDALIGYSEVNDGIVAVYDSDLFIEILSEDMPYPEAIEVFHNNFASRFLGENSPTFVRLNKNI